MTDSQIMPPSPTILAATISITFVGPWNIPDKTMPGFLWVNHCCIHEALLWLKENNPIYQNIIVSIDQLNKLPLDDVPHEIMSLMKHSDDFVQFAHENDGYVPDDDDEFENDILDTNHMGLSVNANLCWICFLIGDVSSEPVVDNAEFSFASADENLIESAIPLQALGVVDVVASGIPDNELLANALANVSRADKTDGWAVKCSGDFMNKYPRIDEDGSWFPGTAENPNHLLRSFPCLFPYGLGGFEVTWHCNVSYDMHAHWALCYEDRCFHTDLHFMFQVFGVIQKRRMCASAVLQILKQSFLHFESAIWNLDSADFEKAATQEHTCKGFTDPMMKSLCETITAVHMKVDGTDEACIWICSLIWGMLLCYCRNVCPMWVRFS